MNSYQKMAQEKNCSNCQWKNIKDDGHCYMFKDKPTEWCHQMKIMKPRAGRPQCPPMPPTKPVG